MERRSSKFDRIVSNGSVLKELLKELIDATELVEPKNSKVWRKSFDLFDRTGD